MIDFVSRDVSLTGPVLLVQLSLVLASILAGLVISRYPVDFNTHASREHTCPS